MEAHQLLARDYHVSITRSLKMNREQTEDLKAFEQRLTECVGYVRAKTRKWRLLLVAVCIWMAVSIWLWWKDDTDYKSYVDMLMAHKSLSLSFVTLFVLYVFGIVDRNNAPQITTSRCRGVLQDFNMSCDEQGKLILKRKPAPDLWRPN